MRPARPRAHRRRAFAREALWINLAVAAFLLALTHIAQTPQRDLVMPAFAGLILAVAAALLLLAGVALSRSFRTARR